MSKTPPALSKANMTIPRRRLAAGVLQALRQTGILRKTGAIRQTGILRKTGAIRQTAPIRNAQAAANHTTAYTAVRTQVRTTVTPKTPSATSDTTAVDTTAKAAPSVPFQVTPSCVQRLQHLSRQRGTNVVLRVRVDGGGCSGFQYSFELEEWENAPTKDSLPNSDDAILRQDDVSILVDGISLSFITGATIDYWQEMISSSFRVLDNPQSEASCGCGTSFAPKQ